MSIASQISRITGLRNTIRAKLIAAGIITDTASDLSACASAIDDMVINSKISQVLDTTTKSVAIPQGYHKEAGTVSITAQTKTQAVDSGSVTVAADSGKVLSAVTVNGPTNYGGTTQDASAVTQDDTYTYFGVPKAGYYNTNSKVRSLNNNLSSTLTAVGGQTSVTATMTKATYVMTAIHGYGYSGTVRTINVTKNGSSIKTWTAPANNKIDGSYGFNASSGDVITITLTPTGNATHQSLWIIY